MGIPRFDAVKLESYMPGRLDMAAVTITGVDVVGGGWESKIGYPVPRA